VAALGVLRRAEWGRQLGVVVITGYALYGLWVGVDWMRGGDLSAWSSDWRWLDPAITTVVAGLALWWLVTRWPSTHRQVG
jgi:hypothetical protein